jgi:hypothetical protein
LLVDGHVSLGRPATPGAASAWWSGSPATRFTLSRLAPAACACARAVVESTDACQDSLPCRPRRRSARTRSVPTPPQHLPTGEQRIHRHHGRSGMSRHGNPHPRPVTRTVDQALQRILARAAPAPSAAAATAPTQPTGHRSDRDGTRATPWTRSLLQWRACFDTNCISREALTHPRRHADATPVSCVTPLEPYPRLLGCRPRRRTRWASDQRATGSRILGYVGLPDGPASSRSIEESSSANMSRRWWAPHPWISRAKSAAAFATR